MKMKINSIDEISNDTHEAFGTQSVVTQVRQVHGTFKK